MGASDSKPSSSPSPSPSPSPLSHPSSTTTPASPDPPKPKCKPCCACPDTRKLRDECVFANGEENCVELIKAHQDCMRAQGFNI
ncbi:uncharacterized protein EV422DRAFT_524924 [Fimicolochytrium jonesii]|uniref:uncharacterized protein n=1 Tax=Fimicolochytrium jonesii TaxID=1396493 RepID=UPI0022FDE4B7|nr:uncharacterized protein EV422DRAFT_524924 [Fimicolochytrium jonesii]KAI8822670.1 hypothetical protein EV422DRAFT_524924 [Fimicolochytrium jonesii]